ncbi:MAG TPA: hypothetical protein VD948_05500, partial [Rhodothermales bacterium]|nr:hypothetical protein [Rhodothermales bacterium]
MRTSLLLTVLGLTALVPAASAQVLIEENFPYAAGTNLTASGSWSAHSGANSNPVQVVARNLTFSTYPSTSGNAVEIKGGSGSREDVNRSFGAQTSGDVFASALIRVDSAGATEDYFFHVADAAVAGTSFRARVYIRDQGTGFQLGIAKAAPTTGTTATYDPTIYSFGTTYLVVLRYSIVAGDNNDIASLYVFEPGESFATLPTTPSAIAADNLTATDITPATVELREGAQGYGMTLDGVRVTRSFANIGTASETITGTETARLDVVGAHPASSVRVRLTTAASGAARIEAYDLLGRRVATLLDGLLAAGEARELTFGGVPA